MGEFVIKHFEDNLLGLYWASENKQGNVIILQGMEEHAKRYDSFAKFLNQNGFDVYAIDCYGQGLNVSEDLSNIGIWPEDGFGKMVEHNGDLAKKLLKEGKPVYLFGHSMGSFMTQDFIERFPGLVEKVVICGCGQKNPAVGLGLAIAKMISSKKNKDKPAKFLTKLMFGGFNKKIENPKTMYDWLSYNEENVNKYIADPLCGFGPRNGFCKEFLKGMKNLQNKKNFAKVSKDQKIFLIAGQDDPVANWGNAVSFNETLYKKLGVSNVQTKVYEHMRHEILNEDNKNIVFEDVLAFFKG